MMTRIAVALGILFMLSVGTTVAGPPAKGTTSGPSMAFDSAFQSFLKTHCLECHGPESQKGDLRLDDLSTDFTKAETRQAWKTVQDRLTVGSMPPAKKPRPTKTDVTHAVAAIEERLIAVERARQAKEGRMVLRRLNRVEYENTLRDLLGVHVEVKENLPADAVSHGFDNLGESLNISAVQMQKYLEAAELAVRAAVTSGPKPEVTKRTHTLAEGRAAANIGKHWLKRPDESVVIFTSGTFPSTQLDTFRVTVRGRYVIRVQGYAYHSKEALPFAVYYGNFGRGGDTRLEGFHEFPPEKPTTIELTLDLDPGDSLQVLPFDLKGFNVYKPKDPDRVETYAGPGLALLGVEVEGPLLPVWPPRGQTLLFGDLPLKPVGPAAKAKAPLPKNTPFEIVSETPLKDADRLLPLFLAKAFRRPVTAAQTAPYVKLFASQMGEGASFQDAMLAAAAAALCAPDFLFLREAPGKLDDFAIATRMSYFLWRTMPDDELLRIAAEKKLRTPSVLRQQTERLLTHPNARRFTNDFTDAWLNLREIDFTTPDKVLYPEYDALLEESMVKETRAFFDEVLSRNLPASTFIASDFAMLNGRLAKHYAIPNVDGLTVRRVPLSAGSLRGGLLTQAAVLKVSANGTNTSPVVRGVYVLERFLGLSPPPPPPGVPAVEPDIRGAKTVRELLDKHREVETCAGCHRMIDPPGFALESFDVIGGFRDKFRVLPAKPGVALKVDGQFVRYKYGLPVDAAGEFADGRRFQGYEEFRKLLLNDADRFAACLAGKLITFATGREIGPADRSELDRLTKAAAPGKHGFREMIHAVVQCELFLNK